VELPKALWRTSGSLKFLEKDPLEKSCWPKRRILRRFVVFFCICRIGALSSQLPSPRTNSDVFRSSLLKSWKRMSSFRTTTSSAQWPKRGSWLSLQTIRFSPRSTRVFRCYCRLFSWNWRPLKLSSESIVMLSYAIQNLRIFSRFLPCLFDINCCYDLVFC